MTISLPPPGYESPEGETFEDVMIRHIMCPIDHCVWCCGKDEPCEYCRGETTEYEQWCRLMGGK